MNAKRTKALELIDSQLSKAATLNKATSRYIGLLNKARAMVVAEDTKAQIKGDTSNTVDVALTRAMLAQVKAGRDAVVALTIDWPAQDPETTITSAE